MASRTFALAHRTIKRYPGLLPGHEAHYNFRTFYLNQQNTDAKTKESWAYRGRVVVPVRLGLDHFSIGAVGYTSQPLYAPEDHAGTKLLGPDQESITVLGQIYGKVKLIGDNYLNLYRYQYDTPFLNSSDNRMIPNRFEGYTLTGTYGGEDGSPGLRYGFGYIDKIKLRDSDEFVSMSEAAGAPQVNRESLLQAETFPAADLSWGPSTITRRTSSTLHMRRQSIA